MRRSHDLMHYADVMGMSVNKETGEVDYLNPQARRYYVGTSGDKVFWNHILESCIFQSNAERSKIEDDIRSLTLQSEPFQFECRKVPNLADSASAGRTGGIVWHKLVIVPAKNSDTGKVSSAIS